MRVTKVKCSVDALFPICPTGLRQPLKATWSVVTPRKVNFLFFYRKKSFPFFNKLSLRTKSYPQRERKQEKGKKIINKVYLLIRLPVVDGQVYSSSPLLFAFIKFFFLSPQWSSWSTFVQTLSSWWSEIDVDLPEKNQSRLGYLRCFFSGNCLLGWELLIGEIRSDCYLRCSSRQEPVGYREVISPRKFKGNWSNGPRKCGTHAGAGSLYSFKKRASL